LKTLCNGVVNGHADCHARICSSSQFNSSGVNREGKPQATVQLRIRNLADSIVEEPLTYLADICLLCVYFGGERSDLLVQEFAQGREDLGIFCVQGRMKNLK
jgi:hypothetical protein